MPWGRLDDGLYDHPKLDLLGRDRMAGVGLWAVAVSWCNRRLTDGVVPNDRIRLLGGSRNLAEKLVDAGLFEHHDQGYLIHDFLDFNDSRETVEARRAADAQRKRRVRTDSDMDSTPDSGADSGRTPSGQTAHSERTPDRTPPGTRARPHAIAPAAARPGPTRPNPNPSPPVANGESHHRARPRGDEAEDQRAGGRNGREGRPEKVGDVMADVFGARR